MAEKMEKPVGENFCDQCGNRLPGHMPGCAKSPREPGRHDVVLDMKAMPDNTPSVPKRPRGEFPQMQA